MDFWLKLIDTITVTGCLALLILAICKIGVPLAKIHAVTQAHIRGHLDRQLMILDRISETQAELEKAQRATNEKIDVLVESSQVDPRIVVNPQDTRAARPPSRSDRGRT